MGSRAAFVTYLPHGSAVVSPLRIGEETAPFCSCTVPEAVASGLPTTRSESGTEPHTSIAVATVAFKVKAKKARAGPTIVAAAAQRHTETSRIVPL